MAAIMNARELTERLGGRWAGGKGVARCPAHEDRNPSLTLADGRDGRLLLHCFRGCSFSDVVAAAGINRSDWKPDLHAAARNAADDAADRARRVQMARDIWRTARPITSTLGEMYLRHRRIGIPLPPTLRYHGALYHGQKRHRLPAVVAQVALGSKLVGIHRIFLTPEAKKIDEGAKLALGPIKGGAVRLSPGPGPLVVTEGIEDALSILEAWPEARAWAAISAGGMAALEFPDDVSDLIVAADPDTTGVRAAQALAKRASRLGINGRIARPDAGDWNDLLRMEAAE